MTCEDGAQSPQRDIARAAVGAELCKLLFDGQVVCDWPDESRSFVESGAQTISGAQGLTTCALVRDRAVCRGVAGQVFWPDKDHVTEVHAGGFFAVAKDNRGAWWGVGDHENVACGEDMESWTDWRPLPCLSDADQVIAVRNAICALSDGQVTCWGTLYEGEHLHQGMFTLFEDDPDVPVITLGDGAPESQEP